MTAASTLAAAETGQDHPPVMPRLIGRDIYAETLASLPFLAIAAAREPTPEEAAAYERRRADPAFAWLYGHPGAGRDELSDLDKGAALLHKREWEGAEYAESDYPCRYFDHPALTALGPLEASRHAASMDGRAGELSEAGHELLYDAALAADRARPRAGADDA